MMCFSPKLFIITAMVFLTTVFFVAPGAQAKDVETKILKVTEVGEKIELVGGSVYSVLDPDEYKVAYHWLPYQDVIIRKNGTELLNMHRGERIDVELISGPKPAEMAAAAGSEAKPEAKGKIIALEKEEISALKQVLERLDKLESSIQVMDWRMREIEKQLMVRPTVR